VLQPVVITTPNEVGATPSNGEVRMMEGWAIDKKIVTTEMKYIQYAHHQQYHKQ
jgi:hypothetical protein